MSTLTDARPSTSKPTNGLTGTWTFIRFYLRRDRIALLAWTIGLYILYVTQAVSTDGLYKTQAEFEEAAATMGDNPAFIAMLGPPQALDTLGGNVAWQISATGAIAVGLMSMFTVGRHTRAEEESGRDEIVRSGVVGRHATFAATSIVAVLANVIVGIVIAAGLAAYGLPTAGSWALGLGTAAVGIVFTAVALLAAQLTESARAMYGIVGAVIAVAYVVRGIGDVGDGTLSWLSPIGWMQGMRPYDNERWWPLLLSLVVAAVLVGVALRLLARRDVGSGILPPRPGPARAGAGLQSALGLAWRLQRGPFIGWAIGVFLVGIAYGSIGTDVEDIMGSGGAADAVAQAGGDLTDSFYATTALMMAVFASAYAIQGGLRARSEELAGRAEPLLATHLDRVRWLWGHTVVVLVGSLVIVGLGGFGTGLMYGVMADDMSQVLRLFGASLAHVPATWVLAGFTVAVSGLVPRFAMVAWAALAYCFIVMMFGEILNLPDWLTAISPFDHSPMVPVADFEIGPPLALTLVAAALLAAGTYGLRRRDIQTT
ncbi:ABC transporter permease [Solicola gregarius]|uniref:ABC transporter permease n=1 Tax=Solicola gregarius TaxID=2908642 RepID=A0AA46TMW7_9ACTN|nr:ABC transporter permease [Solicola gregarius]UYM07313.1 ABC transporter permease [Solicola gregarius]